MGILTRTVRGGGRGSGSIEPWALGALAGWLVITASWWALALWPVPGDAPEWLARARAVCFNTTQTGLPDASGWLLLFGQPLGMLALLYVGWGRAVRSTLLGLARSRTGRLALAAGASMVLGGAAASGIRVAEARAVAAVEIAPDPKHLAAAFPGDLPGGGIDLIDQNGDRITLEQFRGRPVLLTFAFGHCETVCPLVVHNAEAVRRRFADRLDAALLVVTLDPWRDTPRRLPHLARAWNLGPRGHVLGGGVEAVNEALDAWRVQRSRDSRTGDLVHAPIVYLIDAEGRLFGVSRGRIDALTDLAGSLLE